MSGLKLPRIKLRFPKMNPLKLAWVLAWISQIPVLPEHEALDVVSRSNMV